MRRRQHGKRIAAYILSAAMVFSNSSFAVLAEEADVGALVEEEAPEALSAEETEEEEESLLEISEESTEGDQIGGETSEALEEGTQDTDVPDETLTEVTGEDEQIIGDTYEEELVEDALVAPAADVGEEEGEYSLAINSPYGNPEGPEGPVTWVYLNRTPIRLGVNVKAPDGVDTRIKWSYVDRNDESVEGNEGESQYIDATEGEGTYEIAGKALTPEDECVIVKAELYAGEEKVASAQIVVFVIEPQYYYNEPLSGPGENELLPGWTRNVSMDCTADDFDPENGIWPGKNLPVDITNVAVTASGWWEDDENGGHVEGDGQERLDVWQNEDGSWTIRANNEDSYGCAELTYTYTDLLNGEEQTGTCVVFINGDHYDLGWNYDENTEDMLTNSKKSIGIDLYHHWNYGEEWGDEPLGDYTVEIMKDDEGNDFYDTNLVNVEITEDGKGLLVTSNTETGETSIPVRASFEVDGEPQWIENYWIRVNVKEEYYNILPAQLENPMIGETLNLGSVQVLQYAAGSGEAADVTDAADIRIRLEDYDENAWSVEEGTEDDLIPVLTRTGALDTSITLIAEGDDGEGNWQELTKRDFWFDGLDYSVEFNEEGITDPGSNHTVVFTDDTLDLSLNTENLDDKGDAVSIEWSVYKGWDEENDTYGEEITTGFTANDALVTLDGEGLAAAVRNAEGNIEGDVAVVARVMCDGIELWCTDVWVAIADPECSLEWQNPTNILQNDNFWVGNQELSCWLRDKDHPDGESVGAVINDIQVSESYQWDDDAGEDVLVNDNTSIVGIESQGEGWLLNGNDFGWVKLNVTYTLDGSETPQEGIIEIYVSGDNWYLDWDFSLGNDQIVAGGTTEIENVILRHDYIGDDGEHIYGEETDYAALSVQWDEADEDGNPYPTYDPDMVAVEVTADGKGLRITANNEERYGGTDFYMRVMVPVTDEDGNEVTDEEGNVMLEEICGDNIHVNITDSFWNLMPTGVDNVGLGETLDLSAIDWNLTFRYIDEEGNPVDEVIDLQEEGYRIILNSYDENIWALEEGQENEPLPVLKRIGLENGDIRIFAQEAERDENGEFLRDDESGELIWDENGSLTERQLGFDGLDYSVWFNDEGITDPGSNHTVVFTDDTLDLSLNTENLDDKGDAVSIEWSVYKGWDEDNDTYGEEITTGFNGDGAQVTLNGAELAKAVRNEEGNIESDVAVVARVMLDGTELWRTDVWVGIADPECSLEWSKPYNMLQGDDFWVGDQELSCWLRDKEHPDGESVRAVINDIQVSESYQWDDDAGEDVLVDDNTSIVGIEPQDGGWLLNGNNFGWVNLKVSYKLDDATEDTYEETIEIHVSGDNWYLDWDFSSGNDQVLSGDTTDIENVILRHDYIDWENEGEHIYGEETDYATLSVQWDVVDEDGNPYPTYDPNMVAVEVTEDGKGLRITANNEERYGGTDIWIRAMMPMTDEEGNEIKDEDGNVMLEEICGDNIHINVESSFYKIESDPLEINPLLTEELDLSDLNPRVVNETVDGSYVEEEVSFYLEYDQNAWEVKVGTEEDTIPTLIRTAPYGTEVTLVAQLPDENEPEGWSEVTRYTYGFDEIWENYTVDVDYSYGSRTDAGEEGTVITSRVLTDIPLVLTLNDAGLNGLTGYEVEWRVWQWDGEAKEEVEASCLTTYEVAADGNSISLLGDADHMGEWADVEVRVLYKGNDIASSWTHVKVDTCEHSWQEESRVNATCTTAGSVTYLCGQCGARKTESLAAAGHKLGAWTVTKAATCTAAGQKVQRCTVCNSIVNTQPISALGHSYTAWTQATTATVFAAATQTRKCSVCGLAETRSVGTKLAAYASLTASSIKMQVKQKTSAFKVTGMAAGDYVTSWKSSNTKILKVSGKANGTCTLTAQKKTGKATLTITFASGLKKTVKVTVQKKQVTTTKITGVPKKLTLKVKQSASLKPVLTPFDSQQKVTYKTSNKKVATVTSKGKITAKKKGKAVITVTSGKKKVKCTVTVK